MSVASEVRGTAGFAANATAKWPMNTAGDYLNRTGNGARPK
jgi:hypothetical protein